MNILLAVILFCADPAPTSKPPEPKKLTESAKLKYWQIRSRGIEAAADQAATYRANQDAIAANKVATAKLEASEAAMKAWVAENCKVVVGEDQELSCPVEPPATPAAKPAPPK